LVSMEISYQTRGLMQIVVRGNWKISETKIKSYII